MHPSGIEALQAAALSSHVRTGGYLFATCSGAAVLYLARRRTDARTPLQFDVELSERQTLDLSEALR